MKLQSNTLLENLSSREMESLAFLVKETIAKEFKNEKKRIFSAAQLWDIQRRKRNFSVKRIMF